MGALMGLLGALSGAGGAAGAGAGAAGAAGASAGAAAGAGAAGAGGAGFGSMASQFGKQLLLSRVQQKSPILGSLLGSSPAFGGGTPSSTDKPIFGSTQPSQGKQLGPVEEDPIQAIISALLGGS